MMRDDSEAYRIIVSQNMKGNMFNFVGEILELCLMDEVTENCVKRFDLRVESVVKKLPGYPNEFSGFTKTSDTGTTVLMNSHDFMRLSNLINNRTEKWEDFKKSITLIKVKDL